ncbi:MAG TPA: nitrogenase component 1 [Methanotrichaceae archaeon]|nr:nitrogenase component 1 [Methanotrichaceae archaeon]
MAADLNQSEIEYPEIMEAPRYSCALAGAYSTAVATYRVVPILHSGLGCGIGQLFGQFYAGGQNAGGPQGGTNTPCSGLVEEHVIFGGENKLRKLIRSTIDMMDGDLYVVLAGCVPSLIGDDLESVVKEFREEVPIIYVKTAGFTGNSYDGYELFFNAVIDQLLKPRAIKKGKVNILGVVPYQHTNWKGNLQELKSTLGKLGLDANIIFTERNGLENLTEIPAAELNIVLSTWNGTNIAERLKERFGTPYLAYPNVPVGGKQTSPLLREIARKLDIPDDKVEKVIADEEWRTYRFMEYIGDALAIGLPHPYIAVVADSGTAVGVTKFLANELGYLAEVVVVTDNPPEEVRPKIVRELTDNIESPFKPEIVFEADSFKVREKLKDRSYLVLLASSLEKGFAEDTQVPIYLSISFPIYDRLILERSYAGYHGGLTLIEDIISKYVGPL